MNVNLVSYAALMLTHIVLITPTLSYASSVGELELTPAAHADPAQGLTTALLMDTHIRAKVDAHIVRVEIEQQFSNQSQSWMHGRYTFPLPDQAAVDSLTIKVEDRLIKGVIKEKQQAQKAFAKAKQDGKKAGLLKQYRPNLFGMHIANIPPGESITATLSYFQPIEYQADHYRLELPTTLTPRYQASSTATGTATASASPAHNLEPTRGNTQSSPEQEFVRNESALNNHRFTLDLSINAGLPLESVHSNTHRLSTQYLQASEASVSLANGDARLDSDIVIAWRTALGSQPSVSVFEQQTDQAVYSLISLHTPSRQAAISLPKSVTMIVDSSGSMAGESMRQAKQALHKALDYLGPNDFFNIVDFDSQFHALFATPQPVTQATLTQARAMIEALQADGGTEMAGALNFALQHAQPNNYFDPQHLLTQIVFVTDGAVSNEQALFELIHTQLGNTRLFTVAIGSAPNTYFMRNAAKFGRGTNITVNDLAEVQGQMTKLFETLSNPVLRDLNIDWPQAVEVYPAKLPDLYQQAPLNLIVKSSVSLGGFDIQGQLADQIWQRSVETSAVQPSTTAGLDVIWARQKITELDDQRIYAGLSAQQHRKQVLALGLEHQLVTEYTSMVAIEQRISKPHDASNQHHRVPNLMPRGSAMPVPQTATNAQLLGLLGLMFLCVAIVVWRRAPTPNGDTYA